MRSKNDNYQGHTLQQCCWKKKKKSTTEIMAVVFNRNVCGVSTLLECVRVSMWLVCLCVCVFVLCADDSAKHMKALNTPSAHCRYIELLHQFIRFRKWKLFAALWIFGILTHTRRLPRNCLSKQAISSYDIILTQKKKKKNRKFFFYEDLVNHFTPSIMCWNIQ